MRAINPRVEKLITEYLKCGRLSEAWRRAGYKGKREQQRQYAYSVLIRPRHAARLEERRAQMARKHEITIDKILTDYAEAMEIARGKDDAGALIAGATAQAKLVGLLRDRQEIGRPGDFDDVENMSDILAKVAEQAGPEAALAVSKALELVQAQSERPEGKPN